MLCLTLTEHTIEGCVKQVARNRQYISMAELRLDYLEESQLEKASEFPSLVDLPVILTYRRYVDGGSHRVSEKSRLAALAKASEGDFAYVDLESDLKKSDLKINNKDLERSLKARGVKIIRSFHDFNGIPDDVFFRAVRLSARSAIPKIAVTPHSMADVITLFRMREELKGIKEKIIVGLGSYGVCTRILYKKLGSMLSFCCEDESGIGQLSAKVMKTVYRADSVNEQTKVYGIIGSPVLHTLSPRIHNPGFAAIHFNAIYVPFLVEDVRSFFRLAEMIKIYGFSVTIPHKRDVLPYLGKITREVKQVGSCNTVVHIQNMWKGTNTDYYGFLSPLYDDISSGKISSALVIGAGGAARAVVWALHNLGVKVQIVNRDEKKAKRLAMETMSGWDSLENISEYEGKCDLVVNATSQGMEPFVDQDASRGFCFTGKEVAFDLVYSPEKTRFLTRAEEAGCRIITGKTMLLAQGRLQFEAFTGYHYPKTVIPEV